MSLKGRKILILGASGFVGSRVCERLIIDHGALVTGLIRNLGRCARIGRLGMTIVRGNVNDKVLLDQLTRESDVVINLLDGGESTVVNGTRASAKLARQHNVDRYIHMSNAAVLGTRPLPEHTTESAPLEKTGNQYGDTRIAAEKIIASESGKGLRSVSFRPWVIWGPHSSWVTDFYDNVVDDGFFLVDGGVGACNAVYIDNLVDGIIWGIEKDEGLGKIFFITDGAQLTWHEFYGALGGFLPNPIEFHSVSSEGILPLRGKRPFVHQVKSYLTSTVFKESLLSAPVTGSVIKAASKTMANWSESQRLDLKKKLGMGWPEQQWRYRYSNGPAVPMERMFRESGTGFTDISKLLNAGFRPRIDFGTGAELTRQWLSASRFI